MTISGYSSNTQYSNYQTTGTYANKTTSTSQQSKGTQNTQGKPDGPPPPPKGGKGGPDLDTDSDGLWSTEELDEFAAYASTEMGIEIDTENILSTYDTDGDMSISSEEQASMAKDNAFKLPSPQDMMNQMKGFSSPPQIQSADQTTTDYTDTSETINSEMIQKLIESYNQQNESVYTEMLGSSVSYDV